MVTFLVIGDPHFKTGTLHRSEVMIDEIIKLLSSSKPDIIVCLGDVLDRFANIRQEALSQAVDFFKLLQTHAPTYILVGNHDRPNNAVFLTDEHPFNAVKYWEPIPYPITIVDFPIESIIEGMSFIFAPYTPNGRFIEALDHLSSWKTSKLIFAHQDFFGAIYNQQKSETGDRWEKSFPTVISGHIHDYQELSKNIIYIGAPIQHAFNESPEKSCSWITVTPDSIKCERLFIQSPIYWTYKIHVNDIKSFIPPKLPKHSDMKLVIEGTFSEIKGLNKIAKVKEWNKQGIRIQPMVKTDASTSAIIPKNNGTKIIHKPFIVYLKESIQDNSELLSLLTKIA